LLRQQSGELQIRFRIDEPLEVISDAVDPLYTLGNRLRRNSDPGRNPVTVYRPEAIESGLAPCAKLVGDPVQGEHTGARKTLGQNLKTRPVIRMRMRENDPIDGLAQRLHVGRNFAGIRQQELTIEDDTAVGPSIICVLT
jgi:hypothetical protein